MEWVSRWDNDTSVSGAVGESGATNKQDIGTQDYTKDRQ